MIKNRQADFGLLSEFISSRCGLALPEAASLLPLAFDDVVQDRRYWDREVEAGQVLDNIFSNQVELAIFIYRLGRRLRRSASGTDLKRLHGWSRRDCSCEIYFSAEIGLGLRVVHGLGSVIGSRHRIGCGFTIYQGATVGHRSAGAEGSVIGDNVTLFANASILGPVQVGANAVIGAHCVVTQNVEAGQVVAGIPARAVRPQEVQH